ncbi:DcuS/MalK family sensor histidine kinase [Paenibacillus apiarius]|uniref:DcuS/MalK family sensor histidine kinase n=1 Tax=Paenibacillus apiarius TaxID=46240 RepID=UPI00300C4097
MPHYEFRFSLQATIMWLVCGVVALALIVTGYMIERETAKNTEYLVKEKARAIARAIATTPLVADALSRKLPEEGIQRYADHIREQTGMQYVVVMDMNGIRKSHPEPANIGKPFAGGDEKAVLRGNEYVSYGEGTLGTSLRAFMPVRTDEGTQVGAVAAGISLSSVEQAVMKNRWIIYVGMVLGGVAGIGGALLLARKIKRILFGLEPSEIARVLEERNAMLQSAREGIVAVDQECRITLINEEARRLLDKAGLMKEGASSEGDGCVLELLRKTLRTGEPILDAELQMQGLTVLANSVPIRVHDTTVGVIATFRDKTEIRRLAERLTGVRLYSDALRAQTHEFMNKLHVILGLVHIRAYERLEGYISEVASRHQKESGIMMHCVSDPVLAAFLLGKKSNARERGLTLEVNELSSLPEPGDAGVTHELITILGNLIDNAMDALSIIEQGKILIGIYYEAGTMTLRVADNGPGIDGEASARIFEQGFTTKGGDRGFGLSLVQQSVQRLGGSIEVESERGTGAVFMVTIPYHIKGET